MEIIDLLNVKVNMIDNFHVNLLNIFIYNLTGTEPKIKLFITTQKGYSLEEQVQIFNVVPWS